MWLLQQLNVWFQSLATRNHPSSICSLKESHLRSQWSPFSAALLHQDTWRPAQATGPSILQQHCTSRARRIFRSQIAPLKRLVAMQASDDCPPLHFVASLHGDTGRIHRPFYTEVDAPHRCPFGSVARYLVYADVCIFR